MRGTGLRDALFPPALVARLTELADCDPDLVVTDFAQAPEALARADVLLTGWGCPRIDATALDRMPRLRLVAHAAGTVKGHVDPVCWERGVQVTTAAAANAVPVVEFALAQILLAGKDVLGATARYAAGAPRPQHEGEPLVGNYGRVVGIIGASTIGRGVLERLRTFDLRLLLADPTITPEEAGRLGAELVPLDTLMASSDVVSLHAPLLPGTVGMVGAAQLAALRDGATFINTARGRIVDHQALRRELVSGRISAMLDVTDPEPLEPGDELFGLPNVLLTPHIAGSMGNELHRMAALALDEVEHLAAGVPLRHPVQLEDLARMA
jgi:phosphoglycerate dehydrogenase-like enzyme